MPNASCLFGAKPDFLSCPPSRLEQDQVGEEPAHSFSLSGSRTCVCVGMREGVPVNLEPLLGSRLRVRVCEVCVSLR